MSGNAMPSSNLDVIDPIVNQFKPRNGRLMPVSTRLTERKPEKLMLRVYRNE